MIPFLLLVVIVLGFWIAHLRHEVVRVREASQPCKRCGATGSTKPYLGPAEVPNFFRVPQLFCGDCRDAQDAFIGHRFMLGTESRFHFGRAALVEEARNHWGAQATDMLALQPPAAAQGATRPGAGCLLPPQIVLRLHQNGPSGI